MAESDTRPLLVVVSSCTSTPRDVLLARFRRRPRHPGHLSDATADAIAARIDEGEWRPLALPGEVIELDSAAPIDAAALVRTCPALRGRDMSRGPFSVR